MGNQLLRQPPNMRPNAPALISWPFTVADDRVPTKGTQHLHWGVTAFHHVDEQGTFHDSLTIEVEADSEPQAISRAMEIVERSNYRVSWVKEACSVDEALKNG